MKRRTFWLLAALTACPRPNPNAAPDQHVTAASTTAPSAVDGSTPGRAPPAADATTHRQIQQALALAYPDPPLSRAAFDQLLTEIAATSDPNVAAARVFAAARRAPPELLARLWTVVPPTQLLPLARGLAGRARASGPREIPPALAAGLEQRETRASVASVVWRMRATLPGRVAVESWIASATHSDQLAGSRLIASPSITIPSTQLLQVATPYATTLLAHALSAREAAAREAAAREPPARQPVVGEPVPPGTETPEVQSARWRDLLVLTARRAQIAPRQWGNTWREVRDAAPVSVLRDLESVLRTTVATANATQDLPPATLSWFRCENAAAVDKLGGWPQLTLACALEGHEWIALTHQATVLGSRADFPLRRATALQALVTAAQGRPHVLEAAASAATNLPPAPATRLIASLARERDPGVMAALMEALRAHLDHARTLTASARAELMAAPFQQPEGVSLEARVESVRLAQALHDPVPLQVAAHSTMRAIQAALAPDAGVIPALVAAPASPPSPIVLRVATEAGVFELELHPESAPHAVEQVVANARAHRYDGLTIHRLVPGFVAQGGDPRGDGYGGTDQPAPTELSAHPFDRGSVGIPLAGLDTGGTQLFIVLADAPHLDGRYPWAGRVRSGMDAVDGLMIGDRIERVEVLE